MMDLLNKIKNIRYKKISDNDNSDNDNIVNKIKFIKKSRLPNKKGNIIIDIIDDWFVFEDNWISLHDKKIYDTRNNEYDIIDFKEITSNKKIGFRQIEVSKSCIKLNINRHVKVGEIFYI